MEETRNTVSNAQKAAQKKYDQKTKMVSIKYTPSDMSDYRRLKSYLDRTGQSTNGFIKRLINRFFESGQDRETNFNQTKDPVREKRARQESYYPYYFIENETMQLIYDKLGQTGLDCILDRFAEIIESDVEEVLEGKIEYFDDWVADLEERMDNGEFGDKSIKEICKEMADELYQVM